MDFKIPENEEELVQFSAIVENDFGLLSPVLKLDAWEHINPVRLEKIFARHEQLGEIFEKKNQFSEFLPKFIDRYIESMSSGFLEVLVQLMSKLKSRRLVNVLLQDRAFFTRLRLVSPHHPLLALLSYQLDDFTGEMKTRAEVEEEFEELWGRAKNICWKNGMGELGLSPARVLFGTRDRILGFFEKISPEIRRQIVDSCFMLTLRAEDDEQFLRELFVDQLFFCWEEEKIILLPTEEDFSRDSNPCVQQKTEFLSVHDYLTTHMKLLKEESFGHLAANLRDAQTRFAAGSARMMTKIFSLVVVNVKRTSVSSDVPTDVRLEIGVDLAGLLPNVKAEWDQLRPGDVVFACGAEKIRGFEIFEIIDAQNNVLRRDAAAIGDKRVFRVCMDPQQYVSDIGVDYSQFTSILRLGPSESNFKKSLEAVQYALRNPVLPEWLADFFVGYGRALEMADFGPGLTIVDAPPGSGHIDLVAKFFSKTQERTLIVAKSTETLNSVLTAFERAGTSPEWLLKYGGSQEDEYSRTGRINHMLSLRLELLGQVKKLALSIGLDVGLADDYSFSCDAANQFYQNRVEPIWGSAKEFPFEKFCKDFSTISEIFEKLKLCAPFEILRTVRDRSEYLFHCQARVVGMTSTGCAIAAKELRKTPFTNVIIFDSSQMLDIETFICLGPKCEKLVLLGDDNLLGPVLTAGTSLYSRLKKLGAKSMQLGLNSQKIYSHSVVNLFAWRYDQQPTEELSPGEVQFINVEDYLGEGELEPSSHQFQNLGEAEFIVGFYMYLRLKKLGGHIVILAPYNAQKNLLMDVLHAKCQDNPMFPIPTVTTIDQFQSQMADTVLLSLTRTTNPGHIQDIKRSTVALSRARHNLYLFGRFQLFKSIPGEIGQTFEYIAEGKGTDLVLREPETHINSTEKMWKHLHAEMEKEIAKSSSN